VDQPGEQCILAAEYRGDQVELRGADQAPVDAADDDQCEGHEVECFHGLRSGCGRSCRMIAVAGTPQPPGISTLSITWITPLVAVTSAITTLAPSTITPLSLALMSTDSPLTVAASSRPAT